MRIYLDEDIEYEKAFFLLEILMANRTSKEELLNTHFLSRRSKTKDGLHRDTKDKRLHHKLFEPPRDVDERLELRLGVGEWVGILWEHDGLHGQALGLERTEEKREKGGSRWVRRRERQRQQRRTYAM